MEARGYQLMKVPLVAALGDIYSRPVFAACAQCEAISRDGDTRTDLDTNVKLRCQCEGTMCGVGMTVQDIDSAYACYDCKTGVQFSSLSGFLAAITMTATGTEQGSESAADSISSDCNEGVVADCSSSNQFVFVPLAPSPPLPIHPLLPSLRPLSPCQDESMSVDWQTNADDYCCSERHGDDNEDTNIGVFGDLDRSSASSVLSTASGASPCTQLTACLKTTSWNPDDDIDVSAASSASCWTLVTVGVGVGEDEEGTTALSRPRPHRPHRLHRPHSAMFGLSNQSFLWLVLLAVALVLCPLCRHVRMLFPGGLLRGSHAAPHGLLLLPSPSFSELYSQNTSMTVTSQTAGAGLSQQYILLHKVLSFSSPVQVASDLLAILRLFGEQGVGEVRTFLAHASPYVSLSMSRQQFLGSRQTFLGYSGEPHRFSYPGNGAMALMDTVKEKIRGGRLQVFADWLSDCCRRILDCISKWATHGLGHI